VKPTTESATPAVQLEAASRQYRNGSDEVWALSGVSLVVPPGAWVAVTGPSGSGKTTLLNLVATLDRPTSGHVALFGQPMDALDEDARARFRAQAVGLVFQEPHLLPGLTALENVVVAQLPWHPRQQLAREAAELIDAVGLTTRAHFGPNRLSGGERQRVAIARALLGRRRLLVADEPTGNLDETSTREVLGLIARLRVALGLTVLVATHDPSVAACADLSLRIIGGKLVT